MKQQNTTKEPRSQGAKELAGFTLVELIVAVGLFVIVIGIAVGGLVNALRAQRQIAALISADNNVSLVIEQMARELRTGYYICRPDPTGAAPPCYVNTGANCNAGSLPESQVNELDFYDAYSNAIRYKLVGTTIERAQADSSGNFNYQPLTGSNVNVQYLNFTLSGNLPGDCWPPRVTISVGVGTNESSLGKDVVNIQTTVSTRQLDS